MTARQLLQDTIKLLQQVGVDAPRRDAELLLMSVWAISNTDLIIKMHDDVPEDIVVSFERMLQRRLKREPLAYILGVKDFWQDEFMITPDVLVPRPETEHLIESVLKYLPKQDESYAFADIGTGSGCIAISLAKEYVHSHVVACDISDKALMVAQGNANKLHVAQRMSFYAGDLYQALPGGSQFDVIVSNPPYVSRDEMSGLEAELSFEPRFALTDEDSGLTLLLKLLEDAHIYLKDAGLLVLESGLCGMPKAPSTLQKIEDYVDLAGNFRGTVFRKA